MTREIPLTRGYVALVDDADYEWLSQWKWHARTPKGSNTVYAYRTMKGIAMHRVIMDAPAGSVVDHRDHNGLNNTRANLRVCTRAENQRNMSHRVQKAGSPYKGIHLQTNGKWQAVIKANDKLTHVGIFETEIEAALAYDNAARFYFGEFAHTNFPIAPDAIAPTDPRAGITTWKSSSQYKGVSRVLRRGRHTKEYFRWRADITVDGKRIYLGLFDLELDAAHAYDEAICKYRPA